MEDTSMEEKPKRGRPKKVVETAIVPVEETIEAEPPKVKRTRKKPDPETAVSADVSFKSKRGDVNFKALRAPKLERQDSRPYAQIHDMFAGPYDHFSISAWCPAAPEEAAEEAASLK